MQDHKVENTKTYDSIPAFFDEKFERHFYKYVQPKADAFLAQLHGKRILDLGCGAGNHALYFKKAGMDVLCFDASVGMLALCQSKGLLTMHGDMEDMPFESGYFDGVWAYASLLHLKKANIRKVIARISEILKDDGVLGIALKEGEGEGFEAMDEQPSLQRWFNYHSEAELRGLLEEYFVVIDFSRSIGSKSRFMHFLLRKK